VRVAPESRCLLSWSLVGFLFCATPTHAQFLQIQLLRPPQWKNYCLEVHIRRRSLAKSPIFLPVTQGIVIDASVTDSTNTLEQGTGLAWFSVYGIDDIIDPRAAPLAPGESKQNTFCIRDTFPVVGSKGRRQVPLQGNLRIYATYALDEDAWRGRSEALVRAPPDDWNLLDLKKINGATIIIPIPCHKGATKAGCTSPPPIFSGEHGIRIPDFPE